MSGERKESKQLVESAVEEQQKLHEVQKMTYYQVEKLLKAHRTIGCRYSMQQILEKMSVDDAKKSANTRCKKLIVDKAKENKNK